MDDLALPLTLSFPCRSVPGARAVRHWVVIDETWAVRTPHDEGLERIAAALGGGVSCLAAVEQVLPGLRMWWERALRLGGPVIRGNRQAAFWTAADKQGPCCPRRGFPGPADAAAHARSPRHVAHVSGTNARHLAALVRSLGSAADPPPPGSGVQRRSGIADPGVVGSQDALPADLGHESRAALIGDAWSCGFAPAWVEAACVPLWDSGVSPGIGLLLAIRQMRADPAWVAGTASAAGDPGLAEWLAWTVTEADRRDPSARADWLRMGARRADIPILSLAGYAPADALEVSREWGISLPGAAQLLARWVTCGYRPSPASLASVRAGGLAFPPQPPGPLAVLRLSRLLSRGSVSCTDMAVALATWGTVSGALAALSGPGRSAPEPDVRPRQ